MSKIGYNKQLKIKYIDIFYVLALFLIYTEAFICSLYNVFFTNIFINILCVLLGIVILIYLNKPHIILMRISRINLWVLICVIGICIIIWMGNSGSSNFWVNIRYILLYVSFICCLENDRWTRYFMKLSLLFSLVFIFTTIWLYFDTNSFYSLFAYNLYPYGDFGYYLNKGITSGIADHYSHNGIMLANSLVLIVTLLLTEKSKRKKVIYSIILILNLVAMVMCGKRGQVVTPIIAIIIGGMIFYQIFKRPNKLSKFLIVILTAVFTIYIISIFSPILDNYLSRFSGLESDGTVLARYGYWALAMAQFRSHPIFGIGWLHFRTINFDGNDPHNIYIQLLCETGIIGTIIFVLFYISAIVIAYRNLKRISEYGNKASVTEQRNCLYAFIGQVYFLLYGLTGNPQTLMYSLMPYLLACAMGYAYKNKINSKNNMNI